MRRSQQAFSVPSKQTQSSNAKDEISSTASINASSTTLIPSSKLLASKPRDCTLKREQNSCYEHDNGLILVEQLPQPFLNAGRSVFAQEFEHQAVERLHANLKRLVAHPQHVELNALHVVHYAN